MSDDPIEASNEMSMDRTRVASLSFLAAAGLFVAGCAGESGSEDVEAAPPAASSYARVVNVQVEPVSSTSFTERIRLTGTVEANQDVRVSSEESGRIVEVFAEKGARVADGEPLLKIDDAILRAQVRQARARAELARDTWERRKRLWEEDSVGTEQAYREVRAGAEEARANLDALEERLARTTIRAPFEGVLDDRMVEEGQLVSPGTPVARVVEIDTVKITAGVPERFAPDVEPGSSVTVSFDVLPDQTFEGEITFVGSTVNPGNRTFPVEFTLRNPDGVVKPQMIANISVVRRMLDDVVVVPQEALVRIEEGFRAFVVEEEDGGEVVRGREVELGPAQANRVVIEEGLEPGERLVVVGQQQVAGGDRVRIVGSTGSEAAGAGGPSRGAVPKDRTSETDGPEAGEGPDSATEGEGAGS